MIDKIMNNIEGNTKNKDIKERLKSVSNYGWVKFSIVSLIFILWVIWLGSWWVMIFYPLIADMYLTKYIPWTWWKKSKNKMVRNVMGWGRCHSLCSGNGIFFVCFYRTELSDTFFVT